MEKYELEMLKVALGAFHYSLKKIEKSSPHNNSSDASSYFYNMICHLSELINEPDLCDCVWGHD